MKIEMHASGTLHISAENELEAYALSRWSNENMNVKNVLSPAINVVNTNKIIIDTSFPIPPDVQIGEME